MRTVKGIIINIVFRLFSWNSIFYALKMALIVFSVIKGYLYTLMTFLSFGEKSICIIISSFFFCSVILIFLVLYVVFFLCLNLFVCVSYQMLSVSLDCTFLISHLVFTNDYLVTLPSELFRLTLIRNHDQM